MGLFDFWLSPSEKFEKKIESIFYNVKTIGSYYKSADATQNAAALMLALISVTKMTFEKRPYQKQFNLSDDDYETIVLKVLLKFCRKHITNFDNALFEALKQDIESDGKKHHSEESQFEDYKLLYFYGGKDDDLRPDLSMADVLVNAQDRRFRLDPPAVRVEKISVGQRPDLVEKYHVRVFPYFCLVDKNGDVVRTWSSELTGTQVNNYLNENLK